MARQVDAEMEARSYQGLLEVNDFEPGYRVVYREGTAEEMHGCVTGLTMTHVIVWFGNDETNGQPVPPHDLNTVFT